jgi:hypothetical protein
LRRAAQFRLILLKVTVGLWEWLPILSRQLLRTAN